MDDDEQIGDLLTRRRAIQLLGTPALVWFAGCSTSGSDGSPTSTNAEITDTTSPAESATPTAESMNACVVRPAMAQGPFYESDDENPKRSDIRTDTETGEMVEGKRLDLTFAVSELTEDSCSPLDNAIVNVWQADAYGRYSDVAQDESDNQEDTADKDFLRGHQRTDEDGTVTFTTIYPGWYPGRTPHIHFKIQTPAADQVWYNFTSQLFFRESRTDEVYETEPYASRPSRDTTNTEDGIYDNGGEDLILDIAETDDGFETRFHLAIETIDV